MHRQNRTDFFDGCPICLGPVTPLTKERINVRDGVRFELCRDCYDGIRAFMRRTLETPPTPRHPAEGKGRNKWPRPR